MLLVAGNGVEADSLEPGLSGAECMELAVDAHLGLPTLRNSLFQPLEELYHRHAVAQHGRMESCYFSIVLDSLHQWNG